MTQRISVRPRPTDGERAPIIKWRDVRPGTELKATYRGMRQGKFGPLADLETPKGSATVPVPTALLSQLSRVRVGAEVAITYHGKKDSQNGRTYHDFQVDVFNEADLLPEGTAPVISLAQGEDRQIRGSESGGFAPARRPIRQAAPASEPEPEAEEQELAPAKPAGKPSTSRGRALKSVFEGLD